jgi:hypothetical protein
VVAHRRGGAWQRCRNSAVTLWSTGNNAEGSMSCDSMGSFPRTYAWREMAGEGSYHWQATLGESRGLRWLLIGGGNRWGGACTNGLGSPFKETRVERRTQAVGRPVLRQRYGWMREGGGLETMSVGWWPLSCCGIAEEIRIMVAIAANGARGRWQSRARMGSG